MDKFLILAILLTISAFCKGDGNVSVINEEENKAEPNVKPSFKSTLSPRSHQSSTERSHRMPITSTVFPPHQRPIGSFPRVALSTMVGFIVVAFLAACLIYYSCCRNQIPTGFTQFNNENERNPLRGHSRWRNRGFFGRNEGPNQFQNSPEAGNSTHVTVQPVLTLNLSSGEQNFAAPTGDCRAAPSGVTTPPPYNERMKNPAVPNELINPMIPNQFVNPPISSQYMNPQKFAPPTGDCKAAPSMVATPPPYNERMKNPPVPNEFINPMIPNQFVNPPIPSQYMNPHNFAAPTGDFKAAPSIVTTQSQHNERMKNPPVPNEFINPMIPNQFVNPPISSQYMNPPMPSQFINPPMPNNFISPSAPTNFDNP